MFDKVRTGNGVGRGSGGKGGGLRRGEVLKRWEKEGSVGTL